MFVTKRKLKVEIEMLQKRCSGLNTTGDAAPLYRRPTCQNAKASRATTANIVRSSIIRGTGRSICSDAGVTLNARICVYGQE